MISWTNYDALAAAKKLAALTGLSAEDVTGRGGGLTDAAFEKKKDIIRRALIRHGLVGTASGSASEDAGSQIDPGCCHLPNSGCH